MDRVTDNYDLREKQISIFDKIIIFDCSKYNRFDALQFPLLVCLFYTKIVHLLFAIPHIYESYLASGAQPLHLIKFGSFLVLVWCLTYYFK